MSGLSPAYQALSRRLGKNTLLADEADLLTYSYDGALHRCKPDAVALVDDAEQAREVVAWCAAQATPFVARGAGTNLSGGCIPLKGGVALSLARMTRILGIDTETGRAWVEPGAINLQLQNELEAAGWFYAPDPASQKVCTLGGNVAENAGGPRCLKYGTTTNHITALAMIMPDGTAAEFSIEDDGPDMVGLMVGAEGTLGVVTKIGLRILPVPEHIVTILAGFDSIESSVRCVSEIIANGILPRVLEALDKTTVESVEAYRPAGYPKAEAVLLIELDGPRGSIPEEASAVERICRKHGCSQYRQADDPSQRERLWEGRRGAYAAVARIAPNVLVEDGVVPRGNLPQAYRRVREIADRHRCKVAMLFHAGDGNLHPNIAFDERDGQETLRVKAAGLEMLRACVELGGSISGEHGIGTEKRAAMTWLFSPETLSLFRRIKESFDPQGIANPDKILPLADEVRHSRKDLPKTRPLTAPAQALVSRMRRAAENQATVEIRGAGTRRLRDTPKAAALISTEGLDSILELDRSNYTVTAEAGISLRDFSARLESEGFHLPLPAVDGTLGGLLATKAWPRARDHILGMRLLLSSGEVAELGGKVVKNVAGYDAAKVLLGSWGALAVILEVTLKLHPFDLKLPASLPAPRTFTPNPWHRRLKAAFDPDNRLNPWIFGTPS